jgi:hypothetical protein
MSDNQEMQPNMMGHQFNAGTSVYDANGERIGYISQQSHGIHSGPGGVLLLHQGRFFPRDTYVPLSAVRSNDANGVYLNLTKAELMHDRYAVPPATEEPARATEMEPGTHIIIHGVDAIEPSPDVITRGVDTIEPSPDTITHGVATIERSPDTITHGVDTIERREENG